MNTPSTYTRHVAATDTEGTQYETTTSPDPGSDDSDRVTLPADYSLSPMDNMRRAAAHLAGVEAAQLRTVGECSRGYVFTLDERH